MSSQDVLSDHYRIEISGWDLDENFFVERTQLEWSEERGKRVQLHRPLRNGAAVFVRLLTPAASFQSFPIAYQAERLPSEQPDGTWEYRLVQLQPRVKTASPQAQAVAAPATES